MKPRTHRITCDYALEAEDNGLVLEVDTLAGIVVISIPSWLHEQWTINNGIEIRHVAGDHPVRIEVKGGCRVRLLPEDEQVPRAKFP